MRHFIASALLGLAATFSHAALNAYISITGPKGESKGHDSIACSWKCTAVSEVERRSGQLQSGHRKWTPFVVTEKNTQALALLQNLKDAKGPYNIKLVVTEETGTNHTPVHVTITFSGAVLTKVETVNGKEGAVSSFSFEFQKITWTWNDGGKTFNDDWNAPVS